MYVCWFGGLSDCFIRTDPAPGPAVIEDRALDKANKSLADFHIDIDISLLDNNPHKIPLLARKLMGRQWLSTLSDVAVPVDIADRKMLTLMDYRRRQGIA